MMVAPPRLSDGHHIIHTPDELSAMVRELQSATDVGFDFETSGLRYWDRQLPIGFSIGYWNGDRPRCWYVPVEHRTAEIQADPDNARAAFRDALKGARSLVGHNLKFDINMARAGGWEVPRWTQLHDTMIQAYLIDELQPKQLEKVVMALGVSPYGDSLEMKDAVEDWIKSRAKERRQSRRAYLDELGHAEIPVGLEGEYACRDVGHTLALDRQQRRQAMGIGTHYEASRSALYANEMLLVRALADMEFVGQPVDVDYLERVGLDLDQQMAEGGQKLERLFGGRHKWGNDNVIRELLFQELKLPIVALTKRGQPAVDKAAMHVLAGEHKGVEPLMEWRARYKVRNTYTDSLISKVDARGRIHASFVQTGTSTGRLSSKAPNLQNIPSRHPILSKLVRRAFVVDPDQTRIYCDYSQVELRLLAWITANPTLTAAYESHAYMGLLSGRLTYEQYRSARQSEAAADVHGLVAERVFGADPTAPDFKRRRSAAKIINFGVPYGGGPNLLVTNPELSLSEKVAKRYYSQYHQQNPEIEKTKARLLQKMLTHSDPHFVNWASRVRHGRRLLWADENLVSEEERSMFASLVQGSAGELTRFSLVKLWLLQQTGKLPAVTTSTVHDEIQVDCDTKDEHEVAMIVQREMEGFTGLFGTIPVVADLETTRTHWADKEDYTNETK